MRKLLYIIISTIILAACVGNGKERAALDAAQAIINDRPDSALAILDSLEPSSQEFSRSTLRRWQLLRLMAQNKCDTVFRSDSLQLILTDYFDRHGTPNEKMWAHYLLGRAYYDMGEAPLALREYFSAEECADTVSDDCDFRTLMNIHGQTAFVYRQQYMPEEEEKELMAFSRIACRIGDTLNWIRGYEMTIGPHYEMNDTAQCLRVTEECGKMYETLDMHREAVSIYPTAIYIYLKNAQYKKARSLMDIFEKQSGLFDSQGNIEKGRENYYYSQGLYCLGIHQPDTAIHYFNKLLRHHVDNDIMAYKGLLSAYLVKHATDSIVKYAALYESSLERQIEENQTENMARMTAMHHYGRIQKIAYEKRAEAEKSKRALVLTVITSLALLLTVLLLYMKYKESKQEELKELDMNYRQLKEKLATVEEEKALLKYDNKELLTRKESEISALHEQMDGMHDKIGNLPTKDKETLLNNSDEVQSFKKMTVPKVQMNPPDESDWEKLMEMIKTIIPSFHAFINNNKLSTQEMKVCMLTRMHFSSKEMSVLLETTKQNISNIKSRANFKLFKDKSADSLFLNLTKVQ